MLLTHGDTGPAVARLQRGLRDHGARIMADGLFGDKTEAAVRRFQIDHGLIPDGKAGDRTFAALRGRPYNDTLGHSDLVRAAETLDVDLAAIMAVNEVESRGTGFIAPRRPVILFERHVMRRRLIEYGIDAAAAQREHPNLVNTLPGGYEGGIQEHIRLLRAQSIHAPSAPEAASWGLFQIMGYHWQRLGYDSQYAFADAMSTDEPQQLDAFVRFIQADKSLHVALAEHRWADFAAGYNGPAYERNDYDTRLIAAHRRHAAALAELMPSTAAKPAKKPKPKRRKTNPKTT